MQSDPKARADLAKKKEKARELVRQILVEDFHQSANQKTINTVAEKLVKSLTKQVA